MGILFATEDTAMSKETGESLSPPEEARPDPDWTPAQANLPEEDETYPFLDSLVTMRKIKGYVNDENLMPTTTYSLFASTWGVWSTKGVNLFVFTLQFVSYLAVTVSVIDASKPTNKCNFPANVTSPVRASQLISMMYSILVQDGIVRSLYTLRNGYDEAAMRASFPLCGRKNEYIKMRWYMSLSLIFFMGVYAQFLTFVMIMQSSDVLGVLLNYAAVSFIATIDDRMFYLGKRGWLGKDAERHVRLICLADNPDPKPQWYKRMFHSISILFIFATLLATWVTVVNNQTSGAYLPKSLKVDFTDLVHPPLGTFSGFYDVYLADVNIFSTARAVYYERRSEHAFFGYCDKDDTWTFIYNETRGEFDACEWAAKSSPTENFDVVTTTGSQWYGLGTNGRSVPLDSQRIAGWDCERYGLCGSHGTCINNRCQCDEGYFGTECGFPEPCSQLQTDGRLGSFQGIDREWSSNFKILRFENKTEIATVYDHPVYVTTRKQQARLGFTGNTETEGFDIIFFTGRRWALAFSESFYNEERDGDFESYLADFHAHFSNYTVAFLSEPITAINAKPSPDGLSWFLADPKNGPGIQRASSQESSAVLLCTECSNTTNPCYYDGVCQGEGECSCSDGSEGGLCEVPPVGNGRCDPFFNSVTFDMDGGDCCRATCVSSEETICGKDPTGFLDLGFFFCKSTDPLPSEAISGEPFSEAGGLVVLSVNGFVMAAVMADGKVGLFDKSGSQWTERVVIETCPVHAMTMASGPFSSNPIFLPPVVIVISCISVPVQSYFCTRSDCILSILESPPQADPSLRFGNSIGISSDGGVIAVSARGGDLNSGFVDIYRAERGAGGYVTWGRTNETIVPDKASDSGGNRESPSPSATPVLAPSPSPTFDEQADIYEAEDAILVHTEIATKFCPCSGEGYADMLGQGASVEWKTFDIDEGFYEISTKYAAYNASRRSDLLIDGVQVATFDFEATRSWSDWTVESKMVELGPGNHTVMIRADETWGPNIDWLAIRLLPPTESPSTSSAPSTFPTLEPSDAPSTSPTVVPNQVVAAIGMSGNGSSLALLVGDIVDGLTIRIYYYRFDGTRWVRSGAPIRETVCSPDISTKDVIRLSHDGSTLLFSGGNSIKVFDWNDATDEWDQRGEPLEREPSPICRAETIALSLDGNVVAVNIVGDVNATIPSRYENAVVTFSWTAQSRWERREQFVLAGSRGGPLSLASDGRELAVGLPFLAADLSGGIATYEYPRRQCDQGFNGFHLTFTIKPKLTRWTIKILTFDQGIFEIAGGPYFFPNFADAKSTSQTQHDLATVVEEICIPEPRCGNLTVYPTDFGGFNVVANGILTLELESANEAQSYIFGNETDACNFTDT
jgi:hypothetical protein